LTFAKPMMGHLPRAEAAGMAGSSTKPSIFISYAHEDEPESVAGDAVKWLSFVAGFFQAAVTQGLADLWVDNLMRGGDDWDREIKQKLDACDVFILLVSRYSLASEYILETEIATIRRRQQNKEDVHGYPLLLTTTPNYALNPVRDWNIRPPNLKPFGSYPPGEREEQMAKAADEIIDIAAEIGQRKARQPPPRPPKGPEPPSLIPAPASVSVNALWGRDLAQSSTEASAMLGRQPRNLPFGSLDSLFVGREAALAALSAALAGKQSAGIALHGLGGIGKTRLATEYAWAHAADYSALLFVRADAAETLNANLAALAGPDVLDLAEKEARDDATKIEAVLRWLEANPTWLLILDNVDDPGAVAAVTKLMPRLTNGHVVVTARATIFPAGLRKLEVDVLDEAAATRLLLDRTSGERVKAPDDETQARELAREFDGLALALEQAGAYIATEKIGFVRYLKLWKESRDKVLGGSLTGSEKTLATVWATSVDRLSPESRRLLDRLAMIAPDPIPDSLIDVPVPGEAVDYDAHRARAGLYAYSLVTGARGEGGAAKGFVMHRLVQDFARRAMTEERRGEALREALDWINAAFVGDPQDVRTWQVLDPLAPHALAVARRADEAGIGEPTARLFSHLDILLGSKARFAEAEPLSRRALAIGEAGLQPDAPELATRLNNLAELLRQTNRLGEAEPLYRRALAIDEKRYGPDHPRVAIDYNNFALLLKATNRLSEAELLYRRALAIDEASYGPDHPNVAIRLSNLALLLQATNRLIEAEPVVRRALKIDEASFGPDHPNVAIRLWVLGAILKDMNQPNEAEPLLRRALNVFEASLGPDHPHSVGVRAYLAALEAARGRGA
jgi:tetratricopeptide (TPR) repeat protein